MSDELGGSHPCTVEKQVRLSAHLQHYSRKIKSFLVKIQEYVKTINLYEMPNDEHQCIMHKEAQNHEFLGKKVIFVSFLVRF